MARARGGVAGEGACFRAHRSNKFTGTPLAPYRGMRAMLPLLIAVSVLGPVPRARPGAFLESHLLVTWYGNPHSRQMGILGELSPRDRAEGLRKQAKAYADLTTRTVVPAYHLVAVVAQPAPGRDGKYRRRESEAVIRALLAEAREHGFRLVLDIQPGRASVADEVSALAPYLLEPDVDLALDPEFRMAHDGVPGQRIGSMRAFEVNAAIDILEKLIVERDLPPKVLIVHQFTLAMMPDKKAIRTSPHVAITLDMDGFGSQSLKLASYRAVMRQRQLDFAGMKLFYRIDSGLFTPRQVMALTPTPSVVIYQ